MLIIMVFNMSIKAPNRSMTKVNVGVYCSYFLPASRYHSPLDFLNFIIICEHSSTFNYDLISLTPKSNAFCKSSADIFSTRLDFSSLSGIR